MFPASTNGGGQCAVPGPLDACKTPTPGGPVPLPYPNFGCATQRNLAVQVANPADLLTPRTMQPGSAERRDTVWDAYVKGDSTIAKKSADEKVKTKDD